jgi:maleamate amidohydrolase
MMTGNDIYRKQQFGQKTGFGKSPALLVVDFVNGFVDPVILGGGNISEAAAATGPLLDFFRAARLPVIFTRIVYADDGSDAGVWCQKVPRLKDLTESAHASQVVAALAPQAGELVIRKTQASAFFGTHLAGKLIAAGVDSLVVAGCTTSGCIRASVIDAMSMNYRVTVAVDCVGDRAIEPHNANLFDMGQKYADLLAAGEIILALNPHLNQVFGITASGVLPSGRTTA